MRRSNVLWMTLFLALWQPAYAGGGGAVAGGASACPLCATEITQIANNVQLAASYVQQAQQTITTMQSYMTMLQNLQRLGPSALLSSAAARMWTDQNMDQSFKDLFSVVQGGSKIAYSMAGMSRQLQSMQPPMMGDMNMKFDFGAAYRNWMQTSRNTVDSSIRVMGAQAESLQSEQDMLKMLQEQSSSAEGQLQALQAGSNIGIAQINQLQMLRQLMIAQGQAHGVIQKAAEARQNQEDDLLNRANSKPVGIKPFASWRTGK